MKKENSLIFEGLNSAQYEAVSSIEGPQLIIAGAGSGKTKVLTCRIANILDKGYLPNTILALTFTNKASKEMKERIAAIIGGNKAKRLFMGTFHSIFIRLLRDEIHLLGYPKEFSIYDTTDSVNVIKACIKELQLDDKIYKSKEVYSRISMAKNNLVTANSYANNSTLLMNDAAVKKPRINEIYKLYSSKCKQSGAMDFDDILLNTNILFRDFPEALERIRNKFQFIMVDEYQDTNYSQYLILKKLAEKHKNISVVGDDAQSIYGFRGARIENILNFKKDYPTAKTFRLEQNYRSTQTIVNAANSLIEKNKEQIKKVCFSKHEQGELIEIISATTEHEEAFFVASSIYGIIQRDHQPYNNFAILYRTNFQSRVIEEALRKKNMPYKIYAGHSFYERKEVKDFLAYLKLIVNLKDDEAFKRVINFPARGIGDTTIQRLSEGAKNKKLSFYETIKSSNLLEFGLKGPTINKIKLFIEDIEKIREDLNVCTAYEIALNVNSKFGIVNSMKQDTSLEGQSRVGNIEELFNGIKEFVEEGELEYEQIKEEGYDVPVVTLDLYLENVSLISDTDGNDKEEDKNKISLMTIHSSKGLEFPYVYIIGMEENLFPSGGMGGFVSEQDMEEERRLCYVALTRAEKVVKLSYAATRNKWGNVVNNSPSRFLKEIDKQYLLNPLKDIREELFANFNNDEDRYAFNNSYRNNAKFTQEKYKSVDKIGNFSTHNSVNNGKNIVHDNNFIPDSPHLIQVGQLIKHDRFGIGTVLEIEGNIPDRKAVVLFKDFGKKTLLLKYAKIKIIS